MSHGWRSPEPHGWEDLARTALAEDLGPGDVSAAFFAEGERTPWTIEAQAEGVVCGVGIAGWVMGGEEGTQVRLCVQDGDRVRPGMAILEGEGPVAHVLSRERTSLNFLMHLSGIASLTARFVAATQGTNARIVDTRKTTPGLRALQKYAVRCGGGHNHRMGLFDGVMLKDNHIAAAGGVKPAVERVREIASHTLRIEVECATEAEVAEAIAAGVEVVMLDNMPAETMRRVVAEHRGKAVFEASGGVNLESVREIAETGVDLISVGALTHSAAALPLHLELVPISAFV